MSSYVPDPAGLRELGRSLELQAAVLAAAERGRTAAAAMDPRGRYSVRPAPVTAGYRDETRAGAVLEDTGSDALGRERKNQTLQRVVPIIEEG